jgi:hypothetical protein
MILALPNPSATAHDVMLGVTMLGLILTVVFVYNLINRRK